METWATVALVLGSNIIIGLSTFLATKIQVSHADRRFSIESQIAQHKELEARNKELRERRREVRSEPLLKLRNELANMATKLKMLVIDTRGQHYRSDITEDGKNKELEQAVEDLKVYGTSGDFLQTLNLQYDAELLKLVEEIKSNYLLLFEYALDDKRLRLDERKDFNRLSQEVEAKIPGVQELINKRLEEL
jgi:hypothetical protein